MAEIILQGIDKIYPDGTHAVRDVDLHIADGEFMIMVGPSGCAKSTILRMIAGLETPTSGTVAIGGRTVNDVAAKDRDIAMVFQSYALYPHMSVAENMAFGLKLRNMPPNEIEKRIQEAAQILGLEQLLHRKPKQMSGGQRQRVAMGRAIVREPQAFLMDEPLSNLDAKLRVQMRTEIAKLHTRLRTTTVYVTHDQVEAMTLGQRICILRKGEIQQVDTPYMVYTNPANVFVAGFIGSPGMNFLSGQLRMHDGQPWLQLAEQTMLLPPGIAARLLATGDQEVIVGIRPEHMHEAAPGDTSPECMVADVDLTETMGSEAFAYFTMRVGQPNLSDLDDARGSGGSPTFVAKLQSTTAARAGGQVVLKLDLEHVHLFDPRSQTTLLDPLHEQTQSAGEATGEHDVAAPASVPRIAATAPFVISGPVTGSSGPVTGSSGPLITTSGPLIERMEPIDARPLAPASGISADQVFGAATSASPQLEAQAVFGMPAAGNADEPRLRFPGMTPDQPRLHPTTAEETPMPAQPAVIDAAPAPIAVSQIEEPPVPLAAPPRPLRTHDPELSFLARPQRTSARDVRAEPAARTARPYSLAAQASEAPNAALSAPRLATPRLTAAAGRRSTQHGAAAKASAAQGFSGAGLFQRAPLFAPAAPATRRAPDDVPLSR